MLAGRSAKLVIADVRWLLSSPLLWVAEGDEGIENLRSPSLSRVSAALDDLALAPTEALVDRVGAPPKSHKLGDYFEWLVQLWLSLDPMLHRVSSNLVLSQGSRTLGELDVVLENREDKSWIHLEVAVKFYLGLGGDSQALWFGPGLQDRLDKKYYKLNRQQLMRSTSAEAQRALAELGCERPEQVKRMALVCGVLFAPQGTDYRPRLCQPDHLKAPWMTLSAWGQCRASKGCWSRLAKWDWLNPHLAVASSQARGAESAASLAGETAPVMLANELGQCCFIVPDDWPRRAWQRRSEAVHAWRQRYAGTRFETVFSDCHMAFSTTSRVEGAQCWPEGFWLGADNPGNTAPLSERGNQARREELRQRVAQLGLPAHSMKTSDPWGEYPEWGLFVEAEAARWERALLDIAQSLGQVAIWYWHPERGGKLRFL